MTNVIFDSHLHHIYLMYMSNLIFRPVYLQGDSSLLLSILLSCARCPSPFCLPIHRNKISSYVVGGFCFVCVKNVKSAGCYTKC